MHEPRLFNCKRPECAWIMLRDLLKATSESSCCALAMEHLPFQDKLKHTQIHQKAADKLELCAARLTDASAKHSDTKKKEDYEVFDALNALTTNRSSISVPKHASAVDQHLDVWLAAMDSSLPQTNKETPALESVWSNVLPWIESFVFFTTETLWVPFSIVSKDARHRLQHLSKSDIMKLVWHMKFALGLTALAIMDVHWEKHAKFSVPVNTEGAPQSEDFSGWHMVTHVFATSETTEACTKKGTLLGRIV